MKIGGLQKFTLIDFPEKLACSIFTSGCPFRCPWCHNPELVLPDKIKENLVIPEEDIFSFLKERKDYLDGVVITGGEPTVHPELLGFCEKIKKLGYDIKLDTNGFNPKALRALIQKKLVDYVAMDIKAPLGKYSSLIGLDFYFASTPDKKRFWADQIEKKIKESVSLLKEEEVDFEFRTTVVPNLLKQKDILEIAKWLSPAPRFVLQEYRPGATIKEKFEPDSDNSFLLHVFKAVSPFFNECYLRRS